MVVFLTDSLSRKAMERVAQQDFDNLIETMSPEPISQIYPNRVLKRFSFSARRDEEIVVDTTMTRSNEVMKENRQNP